MVTDPDGHNGRNPYGQDPYAEYARDMYEQYARDLNPPYEQYGSYERPYAPPRPMPTGAATAALVTNVIAAVICCVSVLWLPGVVLAIAALNRARVSPESAWRLTVASWVCLATGIVLTVGIMFAYGLFDGPMAPTLP